MDSIRFELDREEAEELVHAINYRVSALELIRSGLVGVETRRLYASRLDRLDRAKRKILDRLNQVAEKPKD